MTEKIRGKTKRGVVAAILFVLAAVSLAIGFLGVTGKTFADDFFVYSGELREAYFKGEKTEIPSAVFGENISAASYLIYPDGRCVKTERAELSQTGIYSVLYRAEKDGKVFEETKTFKVYDKLFYNDKTTAVTEYVPDREFVKDTKTGEKTQVAGIYTELMPGATFFYSEIFDISDKTKDDVIFECNVIATEDGYADFKQLTVRFTDAYDSSNYIDVVLWGNIKANAVPQKDENYLRAGPADQKTKAVQSSGGVWEDRYGLWTRTSFLNNPVFGDASRDVFDVRIDYATKCVYGTTRTDRDFVIDLDDPKYFDVPWQGFKTGECTVSVFASDYMTSKGAIFIQKIFDDAGDSFKENYLKDETAPTITVDYNGYDKAYLPFAVSGVPYPAFEAEAYDASGYVSPIKTDVYFNYHGATPVKVSVSSDGSFVPHDAGYYTVVLSAKDAFGNASKLSYDVKCVEKDEFAISVPELPKNVFTGRSVKLPAADVSGESGRYALKVYAKKDGSVYDVSVGDMSFIPLFAGEYTVVYEATDFIGRTRAAELALTVVNGNEPVFDTEAFFPEYFIAGYEHTVPELYATDYSDGSKKIKAEAFVKEGDGEEKRVSGGSYTPSETAKDCAVTVIYKAVGKNGVSEKRYFLELRNIFGAKAFKIDKKSLFAAESEVTAGYTRVNEGDITEYAFYRADGEFSLRYVNPIPAQDFSINLNVLKDYDKFDTVALYLTDVMSGETIKISFGRDTENSILFSVNDGNKFPVNGYSFDKHDVSFNLNLNSVKKIVYTDNSNFSVAIKTNVFGGEFKGFESGKVYLTVAAENARGASGIVVKKVYNQQLTDSVNDNIPPVLVMNGIYDKNISVNETITLFPAVCQDLIVPETKAYLTVKTPSGKIAVAEDGTRLERAEISKSYRLKPEEYGVYKLSYEIEGFSVPSEWALTVIDEASPVITAEQHFDKKFKRGDTVSLKATATDNLSENVQVYVSVTDPTFMTDIISGNSYTFAREGIYEITFFATDDRGNYAFVKYVIDVRG